MPVKPDLWDWFLSFVWPIQKEKIESSYSGTLTVVLDRGQWRLDTSRATYSHGKKYPPFLASMQDIGFPKNEAKILLLGVGTGSAIDILSTTNRSYHITAVDIDSVILSLAQKYANITAGQEVIFVCADTADWVKEHTGKYDLIFVDIFVHDLTPDNLKEVPFLQKLKHSLSDGGTLLYNQLSDSYSSKQNTKLFEDKFASVFPGYRSLQMEGNQVFAFQENS